MPMSADFLKAISLGLDGAEHMYYPLKACSPVADSLTEVRSWLRNDRAFNRHLRS